DARPLAGCTLGLSFTPDDALDPGTDYQATARWTFAGVAQPDFTWRFHTAGRRVLARAGVRIASKARRVHGRWRGGVAGGRAVGRPASVTIRRYARRWSRLTGATVTRRVKLARSTAVVLPSHAKGWRVHVSVARFASYAATSLTRRVR